MWLVVVPLLLVPWEQVKELLEALQVYYEQEKNPACSHEKFSKVMEARTD